MSFFSTDILPLTGHKAEILRVCCPCVLQTSYSICYDAPVCCKPRIPFVMMSLCVAYLYSICNDVLTRCKPPCRRHETSVEEASMCIPHTFPRRGKTSIEKRDSSVYSAPYGAGYSSCFAIFYRCFVPTARVFCAVG
jgi:hypothetical protein